MIIAKSPGTILTVNKPVLKSLKNDFLGASSVIWCTLGTFIITNGIRAIKNVIMSIRKICVIGRNAKSVAAITGPIV